MPTPESRLTVQDLASVSQTGAWTAGGGALMIPPSQVLTWKAMGTMTECPSYWSVYRDDWLSDFPYKVGNDMLAGAMATLISRIASTSWYVEGPLAQALMYRSMLLEKSEFGLGWGHFCPKWVHAYLSRDGGGLVENLRSSSTDRDGPALGFAHIDESKCIPTGDYEYPMVYQNASKGWIKIHRSQLNWMVDMPNPKDMYNGVGFCSVARALTTAEILLDLVRYKRERLSDLPPAGILFVNNMTQTQWQDIEVEYLSRQENEGNQVWRDVMVAFGIDPAYKTEANFLEFSQLPENYDEEAQMRVAMYSFALAFRVDPREYWPVSSGPLGTATEAEIQQRKAKSKGEGIIFTEIERKFNSPYCLPESLRFRFDYVDDEEDKRAADIATLKIGNIRKLWESSPGRSAGLMGGRGFGDDGGAGRGGEPQGRGRPQGQGDSEKRKEGSGQYERAEDEERPSGNGNGKRPQEKEREPSPWEKMDPDQIREMTMGIISTEEARQLLIHERLIPPEILGEEIELSKVYDVRAWLDGVEEMRKSLGIVPKFGGVPVPRAARGVWEGGGPRARVYSDGKVRLFRRPVTDEDARSWSWY